MRGYVERGRAHLAANEVLVLAELGALDPVGVAADFRDLVLLVRLLPTDAAAGATP